MLAKWKSKLSARVDGSSLAFFRIGFAITVLVEVLRYFYYDWISEFFIKPKYLFSWPLVPMPALPHGGIYLVFFALGLAAVFVALGLFYRAAALTMAVGVTYVFLLDASYSLELNHLYLMCLYSGLLIVVPASNAASLDNRIFGPKDQSVPFWAVFLLRFQIFIVFLFAGFAKLSPEWFNFKPATHIVDAHMLSPSIESLLALPAANTLMIYGGLLVDLAMPWLLLFRRTRRLAFCAVICFMTCNAFIFHIGIFPLLAILATLTFMDPGFPRSLLQRWIRKDISWSKEKETKLPVTPNTFVFLALYCAIQILVPLRAWFYPQPTAWSEEGHFFSWRMMLVEKKSTLHIYARNPLNGAVAEWDPARELTPLQISSLSNRPQLVMQYAHHVADLIEDNEKFRPEVYAKQEISYAGRPLQNAIALDRNLANEPFRFSAYDWIQPLNPGLPE